MEAAGRRPSIIPRRGSPVVRAARLLVVALVAGVGLSQLILTVGDWHLRDANAYWEAAIRVREGGPLYPALANQEASEVYRYAPWFAWAWVPLTLLPKALVSVIWSVVLLAASAAALTPLARARAWLAVAFFAPILVGISAIGNVQPLIVAALVLGVERRTGPLWIAAAASLKAVPILLTVVYLGRREWARAAITLMVAAALVAPALLYDLSAYPSEAGSASLLPGGPIVYGLVVAAGVLIAVQMARGRLGWLSAAATVALATPRFFVYDVTYLMAGIPDRRNGIDDDASRPDA